jgi:hypothetical protein
MTVVLFNNTELTAVHYWWDVRVIMKCEFRKAGIVSFFITVER